MQVKAAASAIIVAACAVSALQVKAAQLATPVDVTVVNGATAPVPVAIAPSTLPLPVRVDESGRVPYEEGKDTTCTVTGDCALFLSTVPAGKRRVIQSVSCFVLIPGGSLTSLTLVSSSFRFARNFLFAQQQSPGTWVTTSPLLTYYAAGETPRVDAFSAGGPVSDLFCTVAGYEVPS